MIRCFYVLAFLLAAAGAHAHDDGQWIQDQGLKNKLGDPCCGFRDCNAVNPSRVSEGPAGYVIDDGAGRPAETIPYPEVMPFSIDGRLWICRNPDRTYAKGPNGRRCVIGPPWKGM